MLLEVPAYFASLPECCVAVFGARIEILMLASCQQKNGKSLGKSVVATLKKRAIPAKLHAI